MLSHRQDKPGTVYDLDLTDPRSESRNSILLDKNGKYIPLFCRHCSEPECAKACMSGALAKDAATGHVRCDAERCGACFMCVMSCPYGVPKPDRATRSAVVKCDFCIKDNEEPNCVKACPKKAIRVEEV